MTEDKLSKADQARRAMHEAWDEEIEKASSGAWKYPVRSQPSRSGLRWVILASVLFWAGVAMVVL